MPGSRHGCLGAMFKEYGFDKIGSVGCAILLGQLAGNVLGGCAEQGCSNHGVECLRKPIRRELAHRYRVRPGP